VFSEKQLIYFTPFYFKSGAPAKNKYFIVLKSDGVTSIIASLPTSINKLPSFITQSHGCINDDASCINCYMFEQGISICDNGYCFPLHTYVHGNDVEHYKVDIFKGVYTKEGTDYQILGTLKDAEYRALLKCILEGGSVKNRVKRLLLN
jgi:hypothetical protein